MTLSTFCLFLCWICSFHSATTKFLPAGDQMDRFQQVYNKMTENDQELLQDLAKLNHLLDAAKLLDQQSSKQPFSSGINNQLEAILLDPTSDDSASDTPDENVDKFNSSPSSSPEFDPVYTRIEELIYNLNQVVNALEGFKASTDQENQRQSINFKDTMSGKIKECIGNLQTLTQVKNFEDGLEFSKRVESIKRSLIEDHKNCYNATNSFMFKFGLPLNIIKTFEKITTLPDTNNRINFIGESAKFTKELLQKMENKNCLNKRTNELKQELKNVQNCISSVDTSVQSKLASIAAGAGGSNSAANRKKSNEFNSEAAKLILHGVQQLC